jgi:hypothetical protein
MLALDSSDFLMVVGLLMLRFAAPIMAVWLISTALKRVALPPA